jgi:rhodanese-related sulfurtransferase
MSSTVLYVLLAVALVYVVISPALVRKLSGVKNLKPAKADALLKAQQAVILDVRKDEDFAQGHIPGAVHIPLEQLKSRFAEIGQDRQRPIIICCNTGHRSLDAATILRRRDYQVIYNLDGGVLKWQKAGLPFEL